MEKIHVRNFIDNSLIFNISIVNDKLIHIYYNKITIRYTCIYIYSIKTSNTSKLSTVKSTIFKEEEEKEE